jgi:hypothetical protein
MRGQGGCRSHSRNAVHTQEASKTAFLATAQSPALIKRSLLAREEGEGTAELESAQYRR